MNMKTLNVMPLRIRLDREKKKSGLTFETVQQDYLLSWILSGLCEHPSLREKLIFKGGTALKKCYFGNYRFSEDLDFSVISSIPRREKLLAIIIEACKGTEGRMNEFAEVRLVVKRYEEKNDHPFEQEAFKVRAQFPWHREPLTSAKIEITMQETVLFPPVTKQVIHPYDERIDTPIQTYSLEEIVLEKLRAILQKGSAALEGALSPLFNQMLGLILAPFKFSEQELFAFKNRSFCISADGAHALHPHFIEKHDESSPPLLGKGVTIKYSANMRYATKAMGAARIKQLGSELGIPFQAFVAHGNIPGGTTIGPLFAQTTGIETIDLGVAQLAMHSSREIIAMQDQIDLCHLLKGAFERV